jgi:ribosomal protein S18 acetylase RimI-like enzyme
VTRGRLTLRTLCPEQIRGGIAEFLAIAADQPDEYWREEHFLHDLPGKWELSFAIWHGPRPVAYAILSRTSPDAVHLHHLMVAAAHRRRGLGARMLGEMEERARSAGARRLTLKVAANNDGARRFYARAGYREVGMASEYRPFEKTF